MAAACVEDSVTIRLVSGQYTYVIQPATATSRFDLFIYQRARSRRSTQPQFTAVEFDTRVSIINMSLLKTNITDLRT